MKLFEVFDRPTDYSWTQQSDSLWRGEFVVGDYVYQVMIRKDPGRGKRPGNWYVELIDKGAINPEFGGVETQTTTTGRHHPLPVLSTAVAMIDEFIAQVNPPAVEIQTTYGDDNAVIRKVVDRLSKRYMEKGYSPSDNRWNFASTGPTQRTTYRKVREPSFRRPTKYSPRD
jgi:hypothetical protein